MFWDKPNKPEPPTPEVPIGTLIVGQHFIAEYEPFGDELRWRIFKIASLIDPTSDETECCSAYNRTAAKQYLDAMDAMEERITNSFALKTEHAQ